MPPVPFPFQLGIGIDLVHVPRIRRILTKSEYKDRLPTVRRFLRRFLTIREENYFWARYKEPDLLVDRNVDGMIKYLAGRWAAKEATIKAVKWRKLSFSDIEVHPSRSGDVYALILDEPAPGTSHHAHIHRAKATKNGTVDATNTTTEIGGLSPKLSASESGDSNIPCQVTSLRGELEVAVDVDNIAFRDPVGNLSGQIAKISISHDGEYASAVCLAAEGSREGDVGGEAAAREP